MADPIGVVVAVFGIESPSLGCSCSYHSICGQSIDLDALIRFKRIVVEGDNNDYVDVCAAYWVSEGSDRCIVGRASEAFTRHFTQLEGRLGQIVEIYSNSSSRNKDKYSRDNDGVCIVQLVDRYVKGDEALNCISSIVESESESEEEAT